MKTQNDTNEDDSTVSSDSYEKLRDELFQYRVEIQSYKRSMRMLWTCVTVVIALLGFFGYNHIETLLNKVEANANERLATTDENPLLMDSKIKCRREGAF